jgi:hypothetical protein
MLYIVAGNNNEYLNWIAAQTRCHPGDTRYVDNADQLRGLRIVEGLFIGTCYDRPDIAKIVDYINVIRSKTTKPVIRLLDLLPLSRYATTDHTFLNTTVPNWSNNNIPVATTGAIATTLGPAYNNTSYRSNSNTSSTLVGRSYDMMISDEYEEIDTNTAATNTPRYDDIRRILEDDHKQYNIQDKTVGYGYVPPSSFKVPLSANTTSSESMFNLKEAKLYKSYITNQYNIETNTIDHYFSDKNQALDFAKAHNVQALAYE